MTRFTFGIQTSPIKTWPEMVADWQRVESLGFDSIWLPDHLVPTFRRELPLFEAWTLLAGLATVTSRIRLGVLVTCNTFRHPALLAKEAATVDHISGGRLELGLGAGWIEFEHVMYGLRYPDDAERVSMFGEALQVIDALLRNDVTTHNGAYYQLTDAPFRPGPVQKPRPPITVAAHGPRMIKLVAPYADRWNSMGTTTEMRERSARLDDACAAIGRDPAEIIRSVLYVPSIMPDEKPLNSPEAFVDFAGRFYDAGVTELILQLPFDGNWEGIERIVQDGLPYFRGR
jgi:F420-dependent oxidoreductase-like protein